MRKGHSFLDNLFFILKTAWTKTRSIIFYMLLHIPVTVLIPLITTLLTKEVVSLVADAADIKTLVVTISILACSLSLLNILNMIFTRKTKVKGTFVRFGYIVQNAVKTMDTDYINIEGPSAQEMLRKSEDAVGYAFSSMTQHIFRVITAGIANTVGLIVFSTLIF